MSKINNKDIVKEKVKKVSFWSLNIVCYISTFLFILFIIIGSVGVNKQSSNTHKYKNEVVEVIDSPSSAIIIDHESDSGYNTDYNCYLYPSDISVSYPFGDYFSDTQTDYASEYIILVVDSDTSITLDFDNIYIINDVKSWDFYSFDDLSYRVRFYDNHFDVIIDGEVSGFVYIYCNNIVAETFSYQLYNAISQVQYADPNDDIFDNIGNSVVGFVGTINSGLTSAISIFYNDGLTTIGILSVIVVSVVLAYFALRMIIGLIRLRG